MEIKCAVVSLSYCATITLHIAEIHLQTISRPRTTIRLKTM